ncbi:MAG: hypothetical protein V2A73_15330, partial [Pseudomonadota bacterium]
MTTEPIKSFEELDQVARSLPPVTVVVAGANDPEVVGGVLHAIRAGIARALLVGEREAILALIEKASPIERERLEIVPA